MKCSQCRKITEERMFATYRDKNGISRRRGICKECRGSYALTNFEELKAWRKNYNQNNKTLKRQKDTARRALIRAIVDKIKTTTPCADCGGYFPAVAMDFDHLGPKIKSVSSFVSGAYKIDLILQEIEKCEVVCACCHRVRTHTKKHNHAPTKNQRNPSA